MSLFDKIASTVIQKVHASHSDHKQLLVYEFGKIINKTHNTEGIDNFR